MIPVARRKSWNTSVKYYYRMGLDNNLPDAIKKQVSSSNSSRWKNESDDKYIGSEVADYIDQELALLRRIGQNSNTKKVIHGYFDLIDTLHSIIEKVKGMKQSIASHKELIVNTIESVKYYIPIEKSIRIFDLSRATYQNYKTLVINKCDSSYFLWCVKKYPHQLLKSEIIIIKDYLTDKRYRYWSKSSVYLRAVRDEAISCGISTWYKYCKLLGFGNRHLQIKRKYTSLKSSRPNEIWCADVTIFTTADGVKHYIHFLMDHYSKKILTYKIEKSSLAIAIKTILQKAYNSVDTRENIIFLTDGGSENRNKTVANYINSKHISIKHFIAQKDIQFSNSKIEAFNKIIKHQFLLPKKLENFKQLSIELDKDVFIYNNKRPQFSLAGNTPNETYSGVHLDLRQYTSHFTEHKKKRILQNQKSACNKCTII